MITITSPNQLLRDGEDLGAVFDAVANHQLNMPDVQRAFLAYTNGLLNDQTTAISVERDKADQRKSEADAKAAELAKAKADAEAFREAVKAVVEDEGTPTDPAVMELIREDEKPARDKAIAAAQAEVAAAQAKLDALLSGSAVVVDDPFK